MVHKYIYMAVAFICTALFIVLTCLEPFCIEPELLGRSGKLAIMDSFNRILPLVDPRQTTPISLDAYNIGAGLCRCLGIHQVGSYYWWKGSYQCQGDYGFGTSSYTLSCGSLSYSISSSKPSSILAFTISLQMPSLVLRWSETETALPILSPAVMTYQAIFVIWVVFPHR
jgi:hypothetical protein